MKVEEPSKSDEDQEAAGKELESTEAPKDKAEIQKLLTKTRK